MKENFIMILVNHPFSQIKIGLEDPTVKITLRQLYQKNKHRMKVEGDIAVNYQIYKNGTITNIDCQVHLGDRFTIQKKEKSGR